MCTGALPMRTVAGISLSVNGAGVKVADGVNVGVGGIVVAVAVGCTPPPGNGVAVGIVVGSSGLGVADGGAPLTLGTKTEEFVGEAPGAGGNAACPPMMMGSMAIIAPVCCGCGVSSMAGCAVCCGCAMGDWLALGVTVLTTVAVKAAWVNMSSATKVARLSGVAVLEGPAVGVGVGAGHNAAPRCIASQIRPMPSKRNTAAMTVVVTTMAVVFVVVGGRDEDMGACRSRSDCRIVDRPLL